MPRLHTSVAPHAVPHAPQFFASLRVSVQALPHFTSFARHWMGPASFPESVPPELLLLDDDEDDVDDDVSGPASVGGGVVAPSSPPHPGNMATTPATETEPTSRTMRSEDEAARMKPRGST